MRKRGRPTDKYPNILADIGVELARNLVAEGLSESVAMECSLNAVEHARVTFGGMNLYFPKGARFVLGRRDEQIYQEFDGTNMVELCQKYGVTKSRIYQIIAAERAQKSPRPSLVEGETTLGKEQ